MTVHLLRGGYALCGKPGPPGLWEPGHKWVGDDERAEVTCLGCQSRAAITDARRAWEASDPDTAAMLAAIRFDKMAELEAELQALRTQSEGEPAVPVNHHALVTSVRAETHGAHAHLSVFVRGALAGTLVVSPEDARPLQLLLLLLGSGKRCIPIDSIPWLVKDFAVLYAAAQRFANACHGRGEGGEGPYPAQLALDAQLARLLPAYESCEAARRMAREMKEGD